MIDVKSGMTRNVLLIWKYAIKIPTFRSWKLFLRGLLANMQENEFSGVWPELCPVVFSVPGGVCSVMIRAEPISEKQFDLEFEKIPEHIVIIAESKSQNYGYLNGKLVAIDYGS